MNLSIQLFSVFIVTMLTVVTSHAATIGEQAPDFRLPSLSEQETGLEDFKGEVVLINFWASWCGPCQEELPELQLLHQKYQERGFRVIGINIDKKKQNAQKFVERFRLSYPILLDPDSSVIRQYRGHSMPISYLIDRKGTVRAVFFGFNRKKLPQMEKSIVGLLDETVE